MTFVIEVTYPWHKQVGASAGSEERWATADTLEEAAQIFKERAQLERFDLGAAVERLSNEETLQTQDSATGRTVTCKRLEGALV